MSEWRPAEGWDEQTEERLKDLNFDAMAASLENSEYYRNIHEAGADAMLAALRKQDIREFSTLVGWVDGNPSGTLVYIPDKE